MQTTLKSIEPSAGQPQTADRFVLYQLRPDEIDDWLPHFADLLDKVQERSRGEIMAGRFLSEADAGHAQLWVIMDMTEKRLAGLMGSRVEVTGLGAQIARIVFCTGSEARLWAHLFGEFRRLAKEHGCQHVSALMRPGWTRLLKQHGFKIRHVEASLDLRD